MGNSTSRVGEAGLGDRSPSINYVSRCRLYLDQKLVDTIKDRWSQEGQGRIKLNRLILKLPSLFEGLGYAAHVFHELDESGKGEISLTQLKTGAKQLGYQVENQLLESAFVSTDVDHSSTLNVDEFVVVLAILHLIHGPSATTDDNRAAQQALDFITRAFLSFQSSKEGFISKDELMDALLEPHLDAIPPSPALTDADNTWLPVAQQRFMELDGDGNGRISFPDFLACMTHWLDDTGNHTMSPTEA